MAQVTPDLDKSHRSRLVATGVGDKLPVLSPLGKGMWASAGPVAYPPVRKV